MRMKTNTCKLHVYMYIRKENKKEEREYLKQLLLHSMCHINLCKYQLLPRLLLQVLFRPVSSKFSGYFTFTAHLNLDNKFPFIVEKATHEEVRFTCLNSGQSLTFYSPFFSCICKLIVILLQLMLREALQSLLNPPMAPVDLGWLCVIVL